MKGNFIKIYNSIREILEEYPELNDSGIRNSIKKNKSYKNFYFKQIPYGQSYKNKISVSEPLCIIDGMAFYKQCEIAKYIGVSRQAVSDCFKRKGKTIDEKNKYLLWKENQE